MVAVVCSLPHPAPVSCPAGCRFILWRANLAPALKALPDTVLVRYEVAAGVYALVGAGSADYDAPVTAETVRPPAPEHITFVM